MGNKKIYGLIGNPLTHSFSADYFNKKFKEEHIDAEYVNFELPDIGDLMELIAETPDLEGFNVTRPYKELILPYLDTASEEVKKIGAANVVKIRRENNGIRFEGYNTDYMGFKDSIVPLLGDFEKKALVLGTGGASKAITAALEDLGFSVTIVSRTKNDNRLSYDDLKDCINDNFLIVNCTPCGTFPNGSESPDLPYDLMDANHLLYDLVYNPSVTQFMARGAARGAAVKNGLEMLLRQAELSWLIWNK